MNCEDGGELAQKTFGDGGALAQMVEGMVGDSHGWWGWWDTHAEEGGDDWGLAQIVGMMGNSHGWWGWGGTCVDGGKGGGLTQKMVGDSCRC